MIKHNGAVMREILSDQPVTVESAHFLNRKYTDAAKALCCHRKYLTFRCIGTKLVVGSGLQTVECDLARNNVALDRSIAPILRMRPCHNSLIGQMRIGKLGGAGVSAVEAHEGIGELVIEAAPDGLIVHVVRHGVVDIQQGHFILAHAKTDVLGKCSVDINFAAYRDTLFHQAAVHIARYKFEHILECRPAFCRHGNIFAIALMLLCPVEKRQLIGCQFFKHITALRVHFLCHIFDNFRNSLVIDMFLIGFEQVQLRFLLDFNAEVVELLDRSVACQEICRPRSERDNLQIGKTDGYSCYRQEVVNHIRAFVRIANRIVRDIGLHVAKRQVVAGVQHSAVCVAAAVQQILLALFGGCTEHLWSVKVLCQQSFGNFRSEISEIYAQRIASRLLNIFQCVYHIDFALDDGDGTFIDVFCIVFFTVCFYQRFPSL